MKRFYETCCSDEMWAFSGYYQCFADNQYGRAMSHVASLQQAILESFATLAEPQLYKANVGDHLMVGTYLL